MTKRTRVIILLVCVVSFIGIAPVLVAYSMGYRYDFEKNKVVATGGIYVRTFPAAENIIIDSNISQKPGLFANSIFVQSLVPKSHAVHISKTGYYDYSKILPVQENQVTKLENVLLIKNKIVFSNLADKADYFSIAPNNQSVISALLPAKGEKNITFNYFSLNNPSQIKTFAVTQTGLILDIKWSDSSENALIKIENSKNIFYYSINTTSPKLTVVRLSYLDKTSQQISFNPQNPGSLFFIKNNTLYSATGNSALPIINNAVSYKISGTNILWLSLKGVLSNSNFSGKFVNKVTIENFPVDNKKTYEVASINGDTFLKEAGTLYKLNPATKTFENYTIPEISDYKILSAQDGKNLIYYSENKIYLYNVLKEKYTEIFSGNKIANLEWLNNDYIIFTSENKILISEIDYRGNINTITLPQPATSAFFNPQDQKLYILDNNSLLVSEKITP